MAFVASYALNTKLCHFIEFGAKTHLVFFLRRELQKKVVARNAPLVPKRQRIIRLNVWLMEKIAQVQEGMESISYMCL